MPTAEQYGHWLFKISDETEVCIKNTCSKQSQRSQNTANNKVGTKNTMNRRSGITQRSIASTARVPRIFLLRTKLITCNSTSSTAYQKTALEGEGSILENYIQQKISLLM
jgi:hypothetical protein